MELAWDSVGDLPVHSVQDVWLHEEIRRENQAVLDQYSSQEVLHN